MKPWFLLPLVGWSIVYSTHLILNAFQGLLWKQQGIPADIIGLLIALGALSETAMFFAFRRFAARNLILASAVVSVARWIAMSFSPGVEILFGLQLLHSVTYALGFLGCVNFIANSASEDIAAEAQSFFVVLQQAMACWRTSPSAGSRGIGGRTPIWLRPRSPHSADYWCGSRSGCSSPRRGRLRHRDAGAAAGV
jgi:PPP family 3-phenylpropionic acid transporter